MAFTWTRDPIVSQTMTVQDQDFEEIYTNLNTLRAAAGLSGLTVPELDGSVVTVAQSNAIRTALLDFEAVAAGTSYMVHNSSKDVTVLCSAHDSTVYATHNATYNTTNYASVTCSGNYSAVNSTNNSTNKSAVYSN